MRQPNHKHQKKPPARPEYQAILVIHHSHAKE